MRRRVIRTFAAEETHPNVGIWRQFPVGTLLLELADSSGTVVFELDQPPQNHEPCWFSVAKDEFERATEAVPALQTINAG